MSAATIETTVEHIPDDMKALPCWVVWKWETRRDPDGEEEKPTKVPYNPRNGKGASTTDKRTWASFNGVLKALRSGRYDGLGFVFNPDANGMVGVDLDKCRDAGTGEIAAWAQDIIAELASYGEVSPSGTGIHVLCAGALPVGRRKGPYAGGVVEMYDKGRFFTVTGAHLADTPETIEQRSETLAAVHARIWPTPPPRQPGQGRAPHQAGPASLSDSELIAKAMGAKTTGAEFTRLWNGDITGHPSYSEAEWALVKHLIFWTRGDADAIDSFVRQSGLWREKWDRPDGQYGTYGKRTITNRLAKYQGSYYAPAPRTSPFAAGQGAEKQEDESSGDADAAGASPAGEEAPTRVGVYERTPGGLVWWKRVGDGAEEPVMLTNFPARIAADVTRDDGVETSVAYDIEVVVKGRAQHVRVPVERFAGMGWVHEHLGSGAIVSAGFGAKDRAREAIQWLSPDAAVRHVYTHTGWVVPADGSAPFFAHAEGAIGPQGSMGDAAMVDVSHELRAYCLPEPPAPAGEEERTAIRASLDLLDVAPDRVTFPLLAAIFRAPLGEVDFSMHLAGQTGAGKSELASLVQRHYGAGMDRTHLPASWKSTANALEALAFAAKDVTLTVDDFCPTGSAVDVARMHAAADNLFRGAGNGAGRARMRADITSRPAKPARALILSTGEEVPRGHSLRARLCIAEVAPGDVCWERLTACQRDAASGVYARTMAGYVRWLAEHYAEWKAALASDLVQFREDATAEAGNTHKRTPEVTANLALGLRKLLDFAQARGAVTREAAEALYQRGWKALTDVARRQAQQQAESEPTRRFLELVNAALASGRAHLATLQGEKPGTAEESWGWRKETRYPGGIATDEWTCQGDRIGWLDGANDVYLEPNAAYGVAQRIAGADSLGISMQTLGKRLKERGLLASWDEARQTVKVRKQCEGTSHNVWHISTSTLSTHMPPDKPDNAGGARDDAGADEGQVSGSKPDNEQNPTRYPTAARAEFNGHGTPDVGFVGFIQGIDHNGSDVQENGASAPVRMSGPLSQPDIQNPTTRQPDIQNPTKRAGADMPTWWPRVKELMAAGLHEDAAIRQALRERGVVVNDDGRAS